MKEIRIGDTVKIRPGICGDGYRFRVSEIVRADSAGRELTDPQVYGHNYGPVRLSEVVAVHSGPIATAQRAAEALLTSIEAGISDLKRENALAVGSLVTLTDAPGGAIWRVLEIDGVNAIIESEGGRRFWRPVARLTVATGAFRTLNPAACQATVELIWSDGISRVSSDVHYQANSWHGSYHIRRSEIGCHVSYEQSRDERGGALPIHFTALGTTPDMAGARALCAAHHAQFGADPRRKSGV